MDYNASEKIMISQGSHRSADKAELGLRGRRLSDDPMNLIEVMLAKGG
jgi:hypothetical protein